MMTSTPFPTALRSWIERQKITQAEAAKRLGMSRRTLENWLQARVLPRPYVEAAIRDRIK